ncbi:hypothetical protein O6H91_22G037100 [Diphasiastrum complanatum]|uniref:Uncharacterized protein n=1 Tax=Diphasiastrum complanatum TaxID=34168 RepID=A0ACC2AEI6_DIPCM|nr:hypothetical protein O6H91_Y162100 [Diphasiastrum complanatum]KAJ7515983.1 hypothetical protein O6H91_22G037100 [Diphasiastrum complanatum]
MSECVLHAFVTTLSPAASHYCEKARWALDRAGVNYTHVPVLHRIYTRNLGGTSCPKLIIGDSNDRVILQDSNDILRYADKNVSEEDWLCPAEKTLLNDVSAWCKLPEIPDFIEWLPFTITS